jgi:hypothetical protein
MKHRNGIGMLATVPLIYCLFLSSATLAAAKPSVREMAEEKLKEKLHEQLEKKLGRDVDVDVYLQALDDLAAGDMKDARGIATEQGMKELMTLCVGSSGAGVIANAWEFDKWVWNSNQEWADQKNKRLFYKEFLEPRINEWIRDQRFTGKEHAREPGFTKELNTAFQTWCTDNEAAIVAIKLRVDKERFLTEFKEEMWNKMLQTIWDIREYHDIRNAARAAQNNLEQERKRLEEQIEQQTRAAAGRRQGSGSTGQGGKIAPADDEAQILAEFKSLWPKALAKVHKGETIRIIYAAEKVGDNQYHCAYKAQSATGDNIRSLACLKRDIQDMKRYLEE